MTERQVVTEEVRIPEQVLAGAAAADALIAEINKGNQDPNATVVQDPDPSKLENTDQDLASQLAAKTQQLSVLQGKYNAEVKALGDDPNILNTLKARVRTLERQNNDYATIITDLQHEALTLKSGTKPKEGSAPAKPSSEPTPELDPEDLAYLADEGIEGKTLEILMKLIDKKSGGSNMGDMAKLSEEIQSLRKDAVESQQEKFFRQLSEEVSNWREINGTPDNPNEDWLTWLDEMAPYQNRSRAAVLHEAQGILDVKTCIDIFNDYTRERGAPAAEPEPTPIVDQGLRIDPSQQLDPDHSNADPSQVSDSTILYAADYKKLMTDFTRGAWRGRDAEFKSQQAIFEKALTEGRLK